MSFYHLLAWRHGLFSFCLLQCMQCRVNPWMLHEQKETNPRCQARSSINLHGLAAGKNCAIFFMSSYLVAPRKEVVVEELLPVEASQAEVEALPVGAVELPLERHRAVVGPVESSSVKFGGFGFGFGFWMILWLICAGFSEHHVEYDEIRPKSEFKSDKLD